LIKTPFINRSIKSKKSECSFQLSISAYCNTWCLWTWTNLPAAMIWSNFAQI
jgi:hypothetical protein